MRRVMHGDLVMAARYLLSVPPLDRAKAIGLLFARAHAADCYVRRFGKAHPDWGDGTLRSASFRGALPPEPPLRDPEYLDALITVLNALRDYPLAQPMHLGVAGSCAKRAAAIPSPQSVQ